MPRSLNLRRAFFLLATALIALVALPAHAQDIAGTWQGTLQTSGHRLVLKISKSDGNTLKVDSYDLNGGAQRVPLNDATFDGSTLKFPLTGHSGNYIGKMSADGNTIVGAWKQEDNSRPVPLTFTRATPQTAWVISRPAGLPPMAEDAHPSFEVATIKPSAPSEDSNTVAYFSAQGRHFSAKNSTLVNFIVVAYGIQSRQILNIPAWADTTKFDIEAEPDTLGQPSHEQYREMYQKLLADRFKLSFHRIKKQFPVYALKPEKGGPKLTQSSGDPKGSENSFVSFGANGGFVTVTFVNYSMTDFVSFLMLTVKDRQVVDQTGLKGRYDFHLTYAPDPLAPDAGSAPDIFQAVQKQLGLKLQPTMAPVDVIVIDHVEPPTPN